MVNQAVIIREEQTVVPDNGSMLGTPLPYVAIPGVEEYMEAEDTALPRIKLLQSNSPEINEGIVGPEYAGWFFDAITGECHEAVTGIVINFVKQRVWFPTPYRNGQDPICASDDFWVPSERIATPMAASCTECPYKEWKEDGTPPDCSMIYAYLMATEGGTVSILSVRSTALAPMKPLNRMLKAGLRSVFKVTSKRMQDERGSWFVAVPQKVRDLRPEEFTFFVGLLRDYADVKIKAEDEGNGIDPVRFDAEDVPPEPDGAPIKQDEVEQLGF